MMTSTFPATAEGLANVTESLSQTLDAAGCPVKARTKLMVAFDEIASNIVNYSGASEFTVEIDFPENPDAVRISFSDEGRPFNPLGSSDPDVTLPAADRTIGGLGLFMVKKMMDNVSYVHENGRNVLTISKLRE